MRDLQPIIIERTYAASIEEVWLAITDKDRMKEWYFDIDNFEPTEGFEFQFYGETENKKYLHLCKVIEVIPQKKLSYTWRYDIDPTVTVVTFELFDQGDKTLVRLTHHGVEKFGSEHPDLARENFMEG